MMKLKKEVIKKPRKKNQSKKKHWKIKCKQTWLTRAWDNLKRAKKSHNSRANNLTLEDEIVNKMNFIKKKMEEKESESTIVNLTNL
jgi:hypothetical protein